MVTYSNSQTNNKAAQQPLAPDAAALRGAGEAQAVGPLNLAKGFTKHRSN